MKTAICALLLAAMAGAANPPRIGTYNRQAVVVAWYNSKTWGDTLRAKTAERDAARQAGDDAKVKELESWGAGQQELAHRQLAGEAPIDNILSALAPALRAISEKAKVTAVADEGSAVAPGTEKVDVTPEILDFLNASEKTRRIIKELRESRQPWRH